jgi:hypothetical protein
MWGVKLFRLHHLSDELLSRLTSGELGPLQGFRAHAHLETCWRCRARRDALERSALQLSEYRNRVTERIPRNPDGRAALVAALRQRAPQFSEERASQHAHFKIFQSSTILMSPVFPSVLVVVCAAGLLLWLWHRPAIPMNAAQLLHRAVESDRAGLHGKSGVIYQQVRITMPRFTVVHEIYRDTEGKRNRRSDIASARKLASVSGVLGSVGVDPNNPLSAASFEAWHDGLRRKSDTVSMSRDGLLTLKTIVPDGAIRQEELTVRTSDFHPVLRKIDMPSEGTIEIAELNFAILDWSGVNESLFEAPAAARTPLAILPPALPSAVMLDEAELTARLTLHRLHADEGEQIEIRRGSHAIEVSGVVEAEDRKNTLNAALRFLPHVKAEVLTVSDLLREQAASAPRSTEVQTTDAPDSSLATYLGREDGEQSALIGASRQLLDAALRVRSGAHELTALHARFSAAGDNPPAQGEGLRELVQAYSDRLRDGLTLEAATLRGLGFPPPSLPPGSVSAAADGDDLEAEVRRNSALCLELISSDGGAERPAPQVVSELYRSMERIRAALAALSGPSPAKPD